MLISALHEIKHYQGIEAFFIASFLKEVMSRATSNRVC